MLKSLVVLALFASSAFALGPEGDLAAWNGRYIVTKCITCPDVPLPSGANIKDFEWFSIQSGVLDPVDREPCAQTDQWTTFGFTMKTAGAENLISRGTQQCDWDSSESLTATADDFHYIHNGKSNNGHMIEVHVHKIGLNLYDFYKHEVSTAPSFGFPKDWEYHVEAELAEP